jgi:UDP-GlcNAc3NAcA epimerase
VTTTILTVLGARPQFVKAAALSPRWREFDAVSELIVHTGQHFDAQMSDVFFSEMNIPEPAINLGIGGGTHGQNTGRMIEAIERVLLDIKPAAVLVYGDTDSTLAAGLATAKLGIPLAHVEAGLRSFRRAMPEEINRVMTDHLADVLYAPSEAAVRNLGCEGISGQRVQLSGDVMCDAVRRFSSMSASRSAILADIGIRPREFHLMTLHRKENTDDRAVLSGILRGIAASDWPVVFPVHPRTRKMLNAFGLELPPNVRPLEPLGYLDALALLASARLVLTDSGGMQKEAYFLSRPCVTLREETEWVELVELGANILAGANSEVIADLVNREPWDIGSAAIYGDGNAASIIAADLVGRIT